MSLIKDITSSFFWRGISIVSNFIIGIILARFLQVDQRGDYALIILTITLLCLFVNFGIPDATIYLVGQKKFSNSELMVTGFVYNLIIALLVCGLFILLINTNLIFFQIAPANKTTYIIGILAVIPQSITSFIALFLLGLKKVVLYNQFMSILTAFQLFTIVAINIFFKLSLQNAIIAYLLATSLGLLFLFYYIRHQQINWHLKQLNVMALKQMLTHGKQFFFTGLGGFATQRINYKFLDHFQNNIAVGIFAVSNNLPNFLSVIPAQLSTVLYSWVSNATSQEEKNRVVTLVFKSAFWLLIAVSIVLVFLLKFLIVLLYGSNYETAVGAAYFLLFSIFISGLTGILINYLLGCGKSKYGVHLTIISITALFIFGFAFVPKLGVLGAGISSFLSAIVGFIYIYFKFKSISKLNLFQLVYFDKAYFLIAKTKANQFISKFKS